MKDYTIQDNPVQNFKDYEEFKEWLKEGTYEDLKAVLAQFAPFKMLNALELIFSEAMDKAITPLANKVAKELGVIAAITE